MNLIFRALALVALAMLAACTTVSTDYAVGISHGSVTDDRLAGSWRLVPKDPNAGKEYVFVVPRKGGGLQAVVVITETDPNDSGWFTVDLVVGKAGDHAVINMGALSENGEPFKDKVPGYLPILYRFEADGRLQLFYPSDDAIKDAIQSGAIAGAVENSNLHITADPGALDAFFAKDSPMLFNREPDDVFEPLQ
jgi:hypothetical protein